MALARSNIGTYLHAPKPKLGTRGAAVKNAIKSIASIQVQTSSKNKIYRVRFDDGSLKTFVRTRSGNLSRDTFERLNNDDGVLRRAPSKKITKRKAAKKTTKRKATKRKAKRKATKRKSTKR